MHSKSFRPLLSGEISDPRVDLHKLTYPVICSPKIDGIRTLTRERLSAGSLKGEPEFVTRSMKPLRNRSLQEHLRHLFICFSPRESDSGLDAFPSPILTHLDGEITVGLPGDVTDPLTFNKTTSAVMSGDGAPQVTYWVFDSLLSMDMAYLDRFHEAEQRLLHIRKAIVDKFEVENTQPIIFRSLNSQTIYSADELLMYEDTCLRQGFEGVMIRSPSKAYKFGRSALTPNQQHLIKFKRFMDGEAEIIGFEELMHNDNEATKDAFGLTERSSHKDNLTHGGTLGALVCRGINGVYEGVEFKIGSGFDTSMRQAIWDSRDFKLGSIVTYKYQTIGAKDAPRFPIFKSFRGNE